MIWRARHRVGLVEDLGGSFGLDLVGELGEMGTALGGGQPPSLGIDGSAIGSIGDRIGSVDLGSVTAAVQSTTAIDLAIIPGADQVLGPLASVLELARTLTSPENVRILADVRSAIDAHPP